MTANETASPTDRARPWFLRKEDGRVYGPAERDRMLTWAAAGRIAPEDAVSRDGEHWAPAPAFAELELCWMMEGDNGERYGPVHIEVFRTLRDEGRLPRDTRLFNTRTGLQLSLAEALPATPIEPASEAFVKAGVETPPTWSVIARERDRFVSEAERWKALYDEEHKSAQEMSEASELRIRELEAEVVRLHAAAEQSAMESRRLRALLKSTDESAGGGLLAAHHELTQRFDDLCTRYDEKMSEFRVQAETLDLLRRESDEREQKLCQRLERERSAADEIRRRLAAMELSYADLLRSLREINDCFIQYRSGQPRGPAPATETAEKSTPDSTTPQPRNASSAPPPAQEKPQGPRIRLTR